MSPSKASEKTAGGIAYHQLGRDLAMLGRDFSLFQNRFNTFENDADSARSHRFHRLTNGGERGRAQGRGGNVIEANHRAIARDVLSGFGEGANGAEGGHIVEREQGGELALLAKKFLGQFLSGFKTGERI